MNFDKESKSEDFFFFFLGGGGGGGGGGPKHTKKNNRYSLIFCAHAVYKFPVPSSSGSLVLTQKRSNGQVRGITLPMFFGIESKVIFTWIINNLLNFRILAQAILYILC